MAVNRERVTRLMSVADYDVTGDTLGDLFEKIKSLIEEYGSDAEVDIYTNDGSNHGYIGVYAMKTESDQQMASRIKQEEMWEVDDNIRNGVK